MQKKRTKARAVRGQEGRLSMYNDESRRKDLMRKINAAMKRQDTQTLEEIYEQLRGR